MTAVVDCCPVCGSALWTNEVVAAHLGVEPGTVSSYRVRGQMPEPDARIGRAWVWLPSTIRSWRVTR